MQSIPLAVLKLFEPPQTNLLYRIACNPYRLRY